MSTFLIACGGTGGHLAPGIALAERLQELGHRSVLVISHKQVDSRLLQKYPHLAVEKVPSAPLAWRPLALARFAFQGVAGLAFAHGLLRRHRPDAVVAFGGFTAVALVLAASAHGRPVALHEANRRPGRAIRALRRLAHRLYLPDGLTLGGVESARLRYTGYPLRREFQRREPAEARRELGLPPDAKVLAILGGSQGAAPLNDWARAHFPRLAAEGVTLYALCGLDKGAAAVETAPGPRGPVSAHWVPFTDRMELVLSAADLVVSRAGAGSIAEMIACQTPSILVPYPFAADRHQAANALFLERQGGAIVVEQEHLGGLHAEVRDLIHNHWLLDRLRANLLRLSRRNAADAMARDLEDLLAERAPGLPRPATA